MKSYAFVFLTIMFALMACTGGGRMEAELSHIDSLTEADQSAAIACIDSITAASGGGVARSVRMRLDLLRAKACNKLLLPLNRDSLLMLDGYFTDHGTPNERMLAKYIIGCSYLDDNDAPRAVECFQKAISCADTLDNKNCDYNTLSRIYAQMSTLHEEQMQPDEATNSGHKAIKYALMSKDTLYAISVNNILADVFFQLNMYDSVMSVCDRSVQMLKKYDNPQMIASALGVKIFMMIRKGEIKQAKPYIDYYEKHSGFYDSKTMSVKEGHDIYYYIKGLSFLYENRLDSAEYLFRKELRTSKNFDNLQAASRGLYLLYKRRGVNDSITKYAEMWNAATDSAYANMSTRHLQQMKAMYDYSRYQLESATAKEDAANARLLNVVVIISSAVVLLAILFGGRTYILRKRRLRLAEIARYERNIDELKKVQREYEILTENREARISSLLEEKSKEIERLQREKAEYEKKNNTVGQTRFHDAQIINVLADHARRSHKCMTVAECAELVKIFSGYTPLSQWQSRLNDSEYHVCLLVRAGFSPADIGILMQQSPSNISNIRKRLYLKMTGKDGSPKDFDKYIKSL